MSQDDPDVITFSRPNTPEGGSQGPRAEICGSRASRRDGPGTFRKHQCLNQVYKVGRWEQGNRSITCKACHKQQTTNRLHRLFGHIQDCAEISDEIKSEFFKLGPIVTSSKFTDRVNLRRNLKLVASIMEGGLCMGLVELRNFKSFVKDLNPRFKMSTRHEISSYLIPMMNVEIEKRFIGSVKFMIDFTLSIEFDHWKDLSHRSFLGVIATRPDGYRYLLELENVSREGHAADVTIKVILGVLAKFPAMKINALISDSASSCKRARVKLCQEQNYRHLFEHRCIAHLVNNIGDKIAKMDPFKDVIDVTGSISSPLSTDVTFLERVRLARLQRIKKPCKTRWYATVDMLESFERLKTIVIEYLEEMKLQRRRESIERLESMLEILNEPEFWSDLTMSIRYLRPLAKCIATIEKADSSLSEAVRSLLEYARFLLSRDQSDRFAIAALTAFFDHFNRDKLGDSEYNMLLAAYFMDRRYKMDYITDDGIEAVLKALGVVANLSGLPSISSESIELALYDNFRQFCDQRGPLSKKADPTMKPSEWWKAQPDSVGILRVVGMRLGNLKATSANIERIFSIIRLTQGLNRTNYKIETLKSIVRGKLSMLQGDLDDELYELLSRKDETEKVPIPTLYERRSRCNQDHDLSERQNEETNEQIIVGLSTAIISHIRQFQMFINFAQIVDLHEDSIDSDRHLSENNLVERLVQRFRQDKCSTLSSQLSSMAENLEFGNESIDSDFSSLEPDGEDMEIDDSFVDSIVNDSFSSTENQSNQRFSSQANQSDVSGSSRFSGQPGE